MRKKHAKRVLISDLTTVGSVTSHAHKPVCILFLSSIVVNNRRHSYSQFLCASGLLLRCGHTTHLLNFRIFFLLGKTSIKCTKQISIINIQLLQTAIAILLPGRKFVVSLNCNGKKIAFFFCFEVRTVRRRITQSFSNQGNKVCSN